MQLVGIYSLPSLTNPNPQIIGVSKNGDRYLLRPGGQWVQLALGVHWDRHNGCWLDEDNKEIAWDP